MTAEDARSRTGVRARRLLWLPSLLAGAAVGAALGTAAGILLYNAPGLARAATVLIVVSGVALTIGVRMGVVAAGEAVAVAGRGWWGLLGALAVGAAYAAGWEFTYGYGAAPLAQGLGLAVTAALPAYFGGGVWGRMARFAASLATADVLRVLHGGLVGAALAVALMVELLGQPVLAATVMLGAMVVASAGARVQGWIFDRVPVCVRAIEAPARPELRFEEWRTGVPEKGVRVLWDGGSDRAVDPAPAGDWRRAAAAALEPSAAVLFVGAASWFAIGDDGEWRLVEPDRALIDLAATGFEWDAARLGDAEVTGRWTVVADLAAASNLWPRLLALSGVERIWLGGGSGPSLAALAEAARTAGFAAVRYLGTRPRSEGPPELATRRQELWRFDRADESLDSSVAPEVKSPPDLPGMARVESP